MQPIVGWSNMHELCCQRANESSVRRQLDATPQVSGPRSAMGLRSSDLMFSDKLDFPLRVLVNLECIKRRSDQEI